MLWSLTLILRIATPLAKKQHQRGYPALVLFCCVSMICARDAALGATGTKPRSTLNDKSLGERRCDMLGSCAMGR